MKTIRFMALAMALVSQAVAAAGTPAFYVLDLRHTGDAVLHTGTEKLSPKVELPYMVLDAPKMDCCFRTGRKPGSSKSPIKIDEDAPPLTSEEGDEIYQVPGYVTSAPTSGASPAADKLAFGIEGMAAVTARGKHTYEVAVPQSGRPVIVRHCLGVEGVNFRLYHSMADKKPYATYYFALGYDTAPDCR
jgi:hypothetical protein